MKKTISLLVIVSMLFTASAMAISLDTPTTENCLGTDCNIIEGAAGSVQVDSCNEELSMNVDLSGLEPGNYQLTIQTYSGDKRLDSTLVCPNPNAPRGGAYENAWECGSWQDYSFYNFDMDVVPAADGTFHNTYSISLPDGWYNTILLVKHDLSDGVGGASYPIVLQKSHVSFSVSQFCNADSDARITALEARISTLEGQTCECADGLPGIQGEQGIQGIQGEKGDKGDQGEQGIPGADGTSNYDEVFDASRIYFPEFWAWYNSDKECINGQFSCEGENKLKCENYNWVVDQVCQYGCTEGICNPQPKDNCLTKATEYYCANGMYSSAVVKDYNGCRFWFGSDTQCTIGKCGYNTISTTCKKGCNTSTGKCN